MWAVSDISFAMVDDATDDPVLTVSVQTPAGRLIFMAEAEVSGGTLLLRAVHVQGIGPNAVGAGNLMVIARAVLEGMGFDEILIEGALRTTGANPGHRPRIFRFTRGVRPPAAARPRRSEDD